MITNNLARLHYTTTQGLLGMFKDFTKEQPNIKLWATHYMYMNDPEEFELGKRICTDIIEQIEQELNIPESYRVKTCVSSNAYMNVIDSYAKTTAGQLICPYTISFSKVYDSLHMWNMYASNGNGIALVFNYKKLLEHEILLKECFYCNPNCSDKIDCVFKNFHDDIIYLYQDIDKDIPINSVIQSMENGDNTLFYQRIHTIHTLLCGYIGIRIKNSAYNIEQEERISVNDKNGFNIHFRDRNGIIVPYIEFPIPLDCVENIVIGPTADFNRVRESILIFLNYKGVQTWDKNKILHSNVPYRL